MNANKKQVSEGAKRVCDYSGKVHSSHPDVKRGFNLRPGNPIEVHVIHLPKAKERKKTFLALNQISGLDYVFEDGIDSKKLDFEDLKKQKLIASGTTFRTPGCGLSHRKLWLKAVLMNKPIVICEDDIVFRKDFSDQFSRCITALPENWEFLLLGYNFDVILDVEVIAEVERFGGRFSNKKLGVSDLQKFQDSTLPVGVLPLLHAFGTPGYAISPIGARHLLDNVFPLRNIPVIFPGRNRKIVARTIDGMMNGLYSQMKAYACFSPLIISPNEKDPNAQFFKIE